MSAKTSSDTNIMSTSASVTKTTKATKTPKTAEAVVVAAPAPAAAAPAAAPAKTSKKAEKAAAAPVAAPVVAAPATTDAVPAAVAAADEDIGVSLSNAVTRQQELVAAAKANAVEQAANLKTIEKLSARLAKKAERRGRKNKAPAVEGAPPKDCIFTKPVRISDELGAFLGKPKNTEVSRSEVTKGIMAYAKAHSLMNKQTINADASLRKLLTLAEGDKLTILNLQKFLRRHYIKATPVAA